MDVRFARDARSALRFVTELNMFFDLTALHETPGVRDQHLKVTARHGAESAILSREVFPVSEGLERSEVVAQLKDNAILAFDAVGLCWRYVIFTIWRFVTQQYYCFDRLKLLRCCATYPADDFDMCHFGIPLRHPFASCDRHSAVYGFRQSKQKKDGCACNRL